LQRVDLANDFRIACTLFWKPSREDFKPEAELQQELTWPPGGNQGGKKSRKSAGAIQAEWCKPSTPTLA
jgi:hypothetical protein